MNPDAELYDRLRDEGKTHEQAVQEVEARKASPAPSDPPQKRLKGTGLLRSIAQGATLGFGDEIIGAVRTAPELVANPLAFGFRLGQNRDKLGANIADERQALDEVGTGTRIAGEIAGGVASGLGAAKLLGSAGVAGAKLLGNSKKMIGTAAGAGAVTGFGTAEGNPAERLPGAAAGGVVGGLLGGATSLAGKVIRPVATKALDMLNLRPATQASQGMGASVARATGIESAEERGLDRLGTALRRDNASIPDLRNTIPTESKPFHLGEMAGDNTLGLMRSAHTVPGQGKDLIPKSLHDRSAGAEERVLSDLLETTGLRQRTNVARTAQDMIKERAETAKPLYEAAHSVEVSDDRIQKFLRIPQFRDAYNRYARIASIKGEQVPDLDQILTGERKAIPLKVLDHVKRGLDDQIDAGMRGGSMGKEEAKALRGELNEMLNVADEMVPEFMQARGYYKGESEMIEALEMGRSLFKMQPDEAELAIASLKTEGEKELARRGMFEALAERIEGTATGADLSKKIADKTLDQKRLRLIFPDDARFEEFKDLIAKEAQMHRGKNFVLGGSNTADKLMEVADLAGVDVGSLMQAATGNPSGLLRGAAMEGVRNRLQGNTTAVADALTPRLLSRGPKALSVLDELEEFERKQAAQGIRRRGIGSAIAGSAGGRTNQ